MKLHARPQQSKNEESDLIGNYAPLTNYVMRIAIVMRLCCETLTNEKGNRRMSLHST